MDKTKLDSATLRALIKNADEADLPYRYKQDFVDWLQSKLDALPKEPEYSAGCVESHVKPPRSARVASGLPDEAASRIPPDLAKALNEVRMRMQGWEHMDPLWQKLAAAIDAAQKEGWI